MPMWCVAPLEMNEGNSLGARVQSAYRLQCRKCPTSDLLIFKASCTNLINTLARNFAILYAGALTLLITGRVPVYTHSVVFSVSLEFFIDIIVLAALWPWGRLRL